MAKVLELINSGTTELSPGDDQLKTGMIAIIQSFQINIPLEPETSFNIPQKIADMSETLEKLLHNMDEEIKTVATNSQNMDEEIEMTPQKMTDKCDEIGMPESSDVIDITTQNMFDPFYKFSTLEIPGRLTETTKSSSDSELKGSITKLPKPYG